MHVHDRVRFGLGLSFEVVLGLSLGFSLGSVYDYVGFRVGIRFVFWVGLCVIGLGF